MSARNECALVGALLVYPDAFAEVVDTVEVADFTETRLAAIYAAMRHIYQEGTPLDFVTVADELDRRDQLMRIGTGYLITLASCAPSGDHFRAYARMVARDGAERRGQPERLPFRGSVRV